MNTASGCNGSTAIHCIAYTNRVVQIRPYGLLGPEWKGPESSDKSCTVCHSLLTPKRSQRRRRLAPRCRLVASWGGSTSQGLGCSPIKAVRELGSERCETVRDLSC